MVDQAANPDLRDRFAIIDPYRVTPKSKTYTDGDLDADIKFIRDVSLSAESTAMRRLIFLS